MSGAISQFVRQAGGVRKDNPEGINQYTGGGGIKVGGEVTSSEHPKATGKVIRLDEHGAATIQWTTPPSANLPYGHIVTEHWPKEDQHLLSHGGKK